MIQNQLHSRYISNITAPDPVNLTGGIDEINQDATYKLIEGATKVEFTSLYANLLVRLHKDGVFDRMKPLVVGSIDPKIIEKVRYFLINRYMLKLTDETEYVRYRTWVNSLYLKELRDEHQQLFDIYRQYFSQYYYDIREANKYSWLYTDTDTMYFVGDVNDINIWDIGLPFSKIKVDLLYMYARKKIIEYSSSDIRARGFNPKSKYYPHDIISMMKSKIRERKIDSLGI